MAPYWGLSLREGVLRKETNSQEEGLAEDAGVGGEQENQWVETSTLWGVVWLWLTKAHVAQTGIGRNESLLGILLAKILCPLKSFSVFVLRDHPPTSMSLEMLQLYLASVFQGLCQWKVWKGKQVLESRGCPQIKPVQLGQN